MTPARTNRSGSTRWGPGPELGDLLDGLPQRSRDAVVAAERDLRTATQSLRAALAAVHEDAGDVLPGYARNVEQALLHLECEMRMAAVQLGVARAQSASDLHDVVSHAGTTWRSFTEDLEVQAHLGQMEARQLTQRLGEEVERAEHRIQASLEAIAGAVGRGTTDALGALRHDAADAVGQVRDTTLRLIGFGPRPTIDETDESERGAEDTGGGSAG